MERLIQADIYMICRIYQQVQNLSKITNGTRNSITHNTQNYIRDPERKFQYKWLHQPFQKND